MSLFGRIGGRLFEKLAVPSNFNTLDLGAENNFRLILQNFNHIMTQQQATLREIIFFLVFSLFINCFSFKYFQVKFNHETTI